MIYVPYAAILVAFMLIYFPRTIVGAEMKKLAGGYDNSDPRTQQLLLEGVGKRAMNAHNNSFEAFPPFAAAVLCCGQTGASLNVVAILSIVFVVARIAYIQFYIADKPSIRSPMWALGLLATTGLFVTALVAIR